MSRSPSGPSARTKAQWPADRRPLAFPLALIPRRDQVPWVRANDWQPAQVLVWGAHGGAGTSVLVAWLHPACDMGSMRPGLYPRYPAWVANGRPVIVACSTTVHAARAATSAVTAVTRAGAVVCVLAAVSDAWPQPAAATARLRLLESRLGAISEFRSSLGSEWPMTRLLFRFLVRPGARSSRSALFAGLASLPPVPDLPKRS
jgi:hypothetical protein